MWHTANFRSGASKTPEKGLLHVSKVHSLSSRNIVSFEENIKPHADYTSVGQMFTSLVIFRV